MGLVLGHLGWEIQGGLANRLVPSGLTGEARQHARDLQSMLNQRNRLKRQIASIATARKLLSIWHAIHIPLGLTLFAMAFVHIIGAIYFTTLLR